MELESNKFLNKEVGFLSAPFRDLRLLRGATRLHVRVLLSLRQPTFQQITTHQCFFSCTSSYPVSFTRMCEMQVVEMIVRARYELDWKAAAVAESRSPEWIRGRQVPPTNSYSLVTKQAVTRGLLTKWVIPTLLRSGSLAHCLNNHI